MNKPRCAAGTTDNEGVMKRESVSRRTFLRGAAATGALLPLTSLLARKSDASSEATADLNIRRTSIRMAGRTGSAMLINGSLPGPLLRFREGQTVTIRVQNALEETASIHWHGLLVPYDMDGVPGVSFPGIEPGGTFTYRFVLRQSGTYWYHSHSGNQEQLGVYGPLVIDPATPDPVVSDRDHIVMLSDWTFEEPARVLAKLKKQASYYNFQQRTVFDLFRDIARDGWGAAVSERLMWARMRMNPTDIADVTGFTYTYLVNGRPPAEPWTALFSAGERVRLRFINAGAMTPFDVRIPDLPMTVIQADGQDVQPVTVEEFRIAPAETYDVIVRPAGDRAHTLFAEAMDRSGYAAAVLAPRVDMRAAIPARRRRPIRTMADMGMADMSHRPSGQQAPAPAAGHSGHPGASTAEKPAASMGDDALMHGPDTHGPGNSMVAMTPRSRLGEPGTGLDPAERRVLVYTDLRRRNPGSDQAPVARDIEMHLTGNMERQMWSIDGKKDSEAPEPIQLREGERVRITLVNDTMMDHPMHLHGMWMVLDNGTGPALPSKHTINVKAGERLSFIVAPDERGPFAFHCHLLFHMELGMFRVFSVAHAERSPGHERHG